MKNTILIYTDGSSLGNPGPGGWAAILKLNGKVKEISGGVKYSTNNRMELTAVIEALECIKFDKYPIKIYSDSRYVVDAINKGWLNKWIKTSSLKTRINSDLWIKFLEVYKFKDIEFHWIKSHNAHPENEKCDRMAKAEALKF
jgi:ribonuclease HI